MTEIQKSNMIEALDAEKNKLVVEITADQMTVAEFLDIDVEDMQKMADAAFNSSLKGKVAAVRGRAIQAKYLAEGKGKMALAEECENEIQTATRLYRLL